MALLQKQQDAIDAAKALAEERICGATYEQTILVIIALSNSRENNQVTLNHEWIAVRRAMESLVNGMLRDIDFAFILGVIKLQERDDLRKDFINRLMAAQQPDGFKII